MSIPKLPPFYNAKWTKEDGDLTPEAMYYEDETNQTLVELVDTFNDYFDNGVPFPNKTTAEISALEPNAAIGSVWFNTSLGKLQVKVASGTLEVITSS